MEEKILAVQRMQEYIDLHLDSIITIKELSEVSFYSPWYSYRLFKNFTGLTVADYIRKLRLSKSALKLRDEKIKIIDIANKMNFQSVDGYQRAFKKEFHCNPLQYAKNPIPIYLFTPYGIKYRYVEGKKMENTKNIFIEVIEKPERKVIMKRGKNATNYFEYCEEVGCDVWGLLTSIKGLNNEPVCLYLPEKYRKENTSSYVQGVKVSPDYAGEVPKGFEVITLPASKYLKFQGEPFEEENFGNAIDEVQNAVQKYNPESNGHHWDKSNPIIQLEPIGDRGYIELHPIK